MKYHNPPRIPKEANSIIYLWNIISSEKGREGKNDNFHIKHFYLLNVGEAISGYFEPGCLRLDVPQALAEVGLDLGEPDKDTLSESDTATFSFSLSVWLIVTGLDRPEPIFVGSLSLLVAAAPADLLLTLESMLLVLDLCPPRPGIPLVLDFEGRGKLRYCKVVFEVICKTPSS